MQSIKKQSNKHITLTLFWSRVCVFFSCFHLLQHAWFYEYFNEHGSRYNQVLKSPWHIQSLTTVYADSFQLLRKWDNTLFRLWDNRLISPRILRILTGYYDRPCSSSSFVRSSFVRSFVDVTLFLVPPWNLWTVEDMKFW